MDAYRHAEEGVAEQEPEDDAGEQADADPGQVDVGDVDHVERQDDRTAQDDELRQSEQSDTEYLARQDLMRLDPGQHHLNYPVGFLFEDTEHHELAEHQDGHVHHERTHQSGDSSGFCIGIWRFERTAGRQAPAL